MPILETMPLALRSITCLFLLGGLFSANPQGLAAKTIDIVSRETLAVVEADSGDRINYRLRGGRNVSIDILDTHSEILFTTLDTPKQNGARPQRTIYRMTCRVRIDGQEMTLVRYNPT